MPSSGIRHPGNLASFAASIPTFGDLKVLMRRQIGPSHWLCFVEFHAGFPVEEVAVVVSPVGPCHSPVPACPRWSRDGPWTSRRQSPRVPKSSGGAPPFYSEG